MTTDYFTSKWIMTVFANSLPFEVIPFIFDNLLQDGWSSIYRIGIALLKFMQDTLLQMDMFEITKFLRESVRKDTLEIDKILIEAEKISILPEDTEHFKSMFIVEQAKLKMTMKDETLAKEQKDACEWAKEVLQKTEPHVKQDIIRFQNKIEEAEKDIKSQEKIMLACKMEYEDIKEQFHQHRDSKKALESVALKMRCNLEKKKKSKFKRLFTSKKKKEKKEHLNIQVNSEGLQDPYLFKDFSSSSVKHQSIKYEDTNSVLTAKENSFEEKKKRKKTFKEKLGFGKSKNRGKSSIKKKDQKKLEIEQLEKDLLEIEFKIGNSENLKNMIQEDYYDKREKYREAYLTLEEVKSTKIKLNDQMAGYLIMYEMKKE
eukprot:CAMPEP_0196999280 /NCGR_PEP_ID=MMETSP1380-20130617/4501_1 /TAXON_ID=5936 /ORGANISM="Euplotes crassus, Strain CT5" /LENGTH=372 /DNA_ID=CAMNT_0042416159 /DNA_START=956 /DNA_END=2071 /DNA_ORIENTATION=+